MGYIAYVCCTAYELNVKIIAYEQNATTSTRESRNARGRGVGCIAYDVKIIAYGLNMKMKAM